jgi:fumarate reductase flavoprotein subunit
MTGTVLEEGLRGAGGFLLNGARERFMPAYDAQAERATRDVVSRAMFSEMLAGHVTPNGGLFISMAHLGPERVARQFKGMVERCADCGFDLAGGLVEVVPTAHYMMGGVEFAPDCSTALPGLFVAGEDAGGVHGANRLGGNGVANSTVYGGVAGDSMAAWVAKEGAWRDPDADAVAEAVRRCEPRTGGARASLEPIREHLCDTMWNKVGIIRDAKNLSAALVELTAIEAELERHTLAGGNRAFDVAWHDWLNLRSLTEVSRVIAQAALAREDSRGAHFRDDFPEAGPLETSSFTSVRLNDGRFELKIKPVAFTRVRPGESLLSSP